MHRPSILHHKFALFVLPALAAVAWNCGKKKKVKEPPLKPLRVEELSVKFEEDLKDSSLISVQYKTFGAKYEKGKSQWNGSVVDRWHLTDSKGTLVWQHKLPQKFEAPDHDTPLTTRQPGQKIGRVLPPGRYTFELRVLDSNSTRVLKKKIDVVKTGEPVAQKPPPVPRGYRTLEATGLHVKLPRKVKVSKGKDGKSDHIVFKKGTMDVLPDGASTTLSAHVKTSKGLRGFKGFVSKKEGPGKGFFAVHKMKVRRKPLFVFTQVLERRGKLWTCVGRTPKKKLTKAFKKVCDALQ